MSSKAKASGKSNRGHSRRSHRAHGAEPVSLLEKRVLWAIAFFVLIRIAVTSVLSSGDRVWGLNFTLFLHSPITLIILALPLIAAIPGVALRVGSVFNTGKRRARTRYLVGFTVVVLAAFVLAIQQYPVVFSFLGDGAYCHTEVYRLKTIPGHISPMFDKATAFGTGQLIRFIAGAFQFDDNRVPFTVLGFAGIILLVPGLVYALRKAPRSHAALLLLALLCSPAVLFFFSYVETYALQYVFVALFFAASYATLTHNDSWVLPPVLLLLSVFFGISSVVFLPALLVLLVYHFGWRKQRLQRLALSLCIGTVLVFLALLAVYGFDMTNGYILPLTSGTMVQPSGEISGWFGYNIFSIAHLIDIVNELLLIAGPLAFGALALLTFPAARTNLFSNPRMLFAAIAALAGICMLIGGNAAYGLARDWDLAAIPATAIAFLFAVMLIESAEHGGIRLHVVLPVLAATIVSGTGLWIGLNADTASAERLEAIVDMDAHLLEPRITSYGYENIRKYYTLYLDDEQRMRILKKMIPVGINVMSYTDQAISLAVNRKSGIERERYVTKRLLDLIDRLVHPYSARDSRAVAPQLIEEYLASSVLRLYAIDEDLSHKLLYTIAGAHPHWQYFEFVESATHPTAVKAKDIAAITRKSITMDVLDPYLLAYGGGYMKLSGNYGMAAAYFEESLQRDAHNHAKLYLLLAQLYEYQLRDHEKAIGTLSRCLDSCRLSSSFDSIKDTLVAYKSRSRAR